MSGSTSYTNRTMDPAVPLLAVTSIFAVYGLTFDAMCATGIAGLMSWAGVIMVTALAVIYGYFLNRLARKGFDSYLGRLLEIGDSPEEWRSRIARFFILSGVTLLTIAPIYLAFMGLFETLKINLENYVPAGIMRLPIIEGLNIKSSSALEAVPSMAFCGESGFHWTGIAQVALAIVSIVVVIVVGRVDGKRHRIPFWFPLALSAGIVAALSLIVWNTPAGFSAREADHLPYLNVYAFAFFIMGLLLLLPRFVLPWIISDFQKEHPNNLNVRLTTTELFQGSPQRPDLSWTRIFYGLLVSPFLHLPQLLLLPGFVALTFPTGDFKFWVKVALAVSWILITWGGMYWRWNQMIFLTTRYFFRGLPLLVSLLIIGLGIARYLDVHYVATLLDMARFGAVTMLVIMLYSLSWLYDHFFNRDMTEALLRYLGAAEGKDWLEYPYQGSSLSTTADVRLTDRFVQRHGADRIAVVGVLDSEWAKPKQAYHIWETVAFFKKLSGDDGSSPQTQINTGDIEAFRSLRRRVLLYRGVMSFLLVAALGGTLWITDLINGEYWELEPVLEVDELSNNPGYSFSLEDRLKKQAVNKQPAILVAASGGGTRAALYAYSVLRGIAEIGQIQNVVLTSGVSGGGVSLAYFATHRRELLSKPVDDMAWRIYRERMAAPYVNDVLEGILEPRIYWDTRLGILLEESFSRHFGKRDNAQIAEKLYEADMGLIFNTSITAHPRHSAHLTTRMHKECGKDKKDDAFRALNVLGGGRLVLTNLKETGGFEQIPRLNKGEPFEGDDQNAVLKRQIAADVYLPYRVVNNKQVKLTTAGALNANFPPVFFDAPVVINKGEKEDCRNDRFYVTDGGATDNRGLISLLYVLKETLKGMKTADIPEIHIVVAEASATGSDYSSELGLGTALSSAKEVLASGLINEIRNDIGTESKIPRVTYLNMPAVLRSRGGLGTHWLMPGTVTLKEPFTTDPDEAKKKTVDARDFKCTMDILYGSYDKLDQECKGFLERFVEDAESGVDAEKIKKALWLITKTENHPYQSPDYHLEAWEAFTGMFSDRPSDPSEQGTQ